MEGDPEQRYLVRSGYKLIRKMQGYDYKVIDPKMRKSTVMALEY